VGLYARSGCGGPGVWCFLCSPLPLFHRLGVLAKTFGDEHVPRRVVDELEPVGSEMDPPEPSRNHDGDVFRVHQPEEVQHAAAGAALPVVVKVLGERTGGGHEAVREDVVGGVADFFGGLEGGEEVGDVFGGGNAAEMCLERAFAVNEGFTAGVQDRWNV